MITVRKSEDRGHANKDWLVSHHTFTFGSYQDPKHSGFRALRVINDDTVAAGRGFGAHAHRDMEILSYVLEGTLAHRDSMGHTEYLGPNEIQKMSAGDGVVHSEFNGSESEPVHFLQIWIEPRAEGAHPGYQQIKFAPEEKRNRLKLLASPDQADGAVQINQDAKMSVAELTPGVRLDYKLGAERGAWLHVVKGNINLNGTPLHDSDAAAIENETFLHIEGVGPDLAEVLLFDLA